MATLSIDPGPQRSGFVIVENGKVIEFGKIKLNEIKLLKEKHSIDTVLIEVTDWPVFNAGESYRDTCIVIGRIVEYYHKSALVVPVGRKAAKDHFKLKNDTEVIRFLKSQGIDFGKQKDKDHWHAYFIYHYNSL